MSGTRYHLALGHSREARAAVLSKHPYTLVSYAGRKRISVPKLLESYAEIPGARFILDSGAWSAFNSGHAIELADYARFSQGVLYKYGGAVKIELINLDVIGDHTQSMANLRELERLGLSPVPVFTRGGDMGELRELARDYPRLCLGGLVPLARNRKGLEDWLDRCYDTLGTGKGTHTLGIGAVWVMNKYAPESCDSTGFTRVARFMGGLAAPEGETQGDMKIRLYAAEIGRILGIIERGLEA